MKHLLILITLLFVCCTIAQTEFVVVPHPRCFNCGSAWEDDSDPLLPSGRKICTRCYFRVVARLVDRELSAKPVASAPASPKTTPAPDQKPRTWSEIYHAVVSKLTGSRP